MGIVSISLPESLVAELDAAQKSLGFSGKSDLYRAALSSFLSTQKINFTDKASYTAVITVIASESHKHDIHQLLHQAQVKSQFHMCLEKNRCMEVFGVFGTGANLRKIITQLESIPKVEKVHVAY